MQPVTTTALTDNACSEAETCLQPNPRFYTFPDHKLMTANSAVNLWTSADHAHQYLERADSISHRKEGEAALLEFIPSTVRRILELGTGDGRLLALVRGQHPETEAVALDFSP